MKNEIEKCKNSPYYFATTYLVIKNDSEIIPFETRLNEKAFNEYFIK